MRHITRYVNPKISKICLHAIKLEQISSLVIKYLPDNLKEHCQVGGFNNGCLILVVNDPVWASHLRYATPELRDTLRNDAKLYQLTSIKITVSNEPPSDNNYLTTTTKPSRESPWKNILKLLS